MNGVVEDDDGQAYEDIDGLLKAIARAVCFRPAHPLTTAELRFLRKRLRMSQQDVGNLGGKSAQGVALWEKGTRPVPLAESNLLRIMWLGKHSKKDLARWMQCLSSGQGADVLRDYVFRFSADGWKEDIDAAITVSEVSSRSAS